MISRAEGTRRNRCWQVQLFLPHIPLLLLIKFDLYEDIADVLFISALWDNPQVPSGRHDLYVLNRNWKEKKRKEKTATVLAPAGVYFNEIQWDEI